MEWLQLSVLSGEQVTAFKGSTGGLLPSQLITLIVTIMAVISLLWLSWLIYSSFKIWAVGQIDFYQMIITFFRGSIIVMFMVFLFNNFFNF